MPPSYLSRYLPLHPPLSLNGCARDHTLFHTVHTLSHTVTHSEITLSHTLLHTVRDHTHTLSHSCTQCASTQDQGSPLGWDAAHFPDSLDVQTPARTAPTVSEYLSLQGTKLSQKPPSRARLEKAGRPTSLDKTNLMSTDFHDLVSIRSTKEASTPMCANGHDQHHVPEILKSR
jgi:hypothetical protein